MSVKRQLFVSCNARGLELGAEQIGFGLPLILGFTLSPQHSHATALPTRYYIHKATKSAGWHGRQAAWVDKEALSLSPVFQLSRHCTNGGVAAVPKPPAAAPNALQHVRSITSHPLQLHPSHSSSGSSNSGSRMPTAASAAGYPLGATRGSSQVTAATAADSAAATPAALPQACEQTALQCTVAAVDSKLPWLGAELDVAGYTKKGFMRGGGKEQNQDRGLIVQQFRSPQEMLIGVMDGHGTFGHLVSTYVVQHLPAVLMQKLVAAAAALHNSSTHDDSSNSDIHSKGRRPLGHDDCADKHPQQQQQLQYVVVPDHSSSINSSSLVTDLHEQQQQQQKEGRRGGAPHRRGRVVSRHKVIHQPEHLQLNSSSSDSSSSSRSGSVAGPHTVPSRLVQHVPLSKGLLQAVFSETDHMLNCSGVNVMDSGSTALITHIGPDTLTTAWVGDSRAVLGRRLVDTDKGLRTPKQQQRQQWNAGGSSSSQRWQVIQLSDDHKPERPDEQLRIVMNNGRVAQMQNAAGQGIGPYRVWFKQLDYPGLAMSRAFGDVPCRRIGVTVEPQLYVHRLTADDQVLVAASDGVWEYLSNQEAVELVGGCDSASDAARKLVEAAEQRWQQMERGNYIDDITAVVVRATHSHKQITSRL